MTQDDERPPGERAAPPTDQDGEKVQARDAKTDPPGLGGTGQVRQRRNPPSEWHRFRSALARSFLLTSWVWIFFTISLNTLGLALTAFLVHRQEAMAEWLLFAAVANLLLAVMSRLEWFVTNLHRFGMRQRTFRMHTATHRIGQLHKSGAAFAVVWLCAYAYVAWPTLPVLQRWLTATLLLTLAFVAVTALRPMRFRFHNLFEFAHKYVGRFAALTALLTVLIGAAASPNPGSGASRWEFDLAAMLTLALMLLICVVIFWPWVGVTGVEPHIAFANEKVVALSLPGQVHPGAYVRISLDRREWHAFAVSMLDPDQNPNEYNLIIRKAGDWTTKLISEVNEGRAPERLYVRRNEQFGFMFHIRSFDEVRIIATGAGIVPVLPHLFLGTSRFHLLWVAHSPRSEFGELVDKVQGAAQSCEIVDTSVEPSPDAREAVRLAAGLGHGPLFVVSNYDMTMQICDEAMKAGLEPYGAVFDS